MLIAPGIRTIVFDPTSFLKPRRRRLAKTDRLDAEEMTRILRTWLSGDRAVATAVIGALLRDARGRAAAKRAVKGESPSERGLSQ